VARWKVWLVALAFAHGAIQWAAADVATTVYTISGLSFQPVALRFWWMGLGSATDAASEAIHSRRGGGFATGTASRRCVASQDQDAVGTTVSTAGLFADCIAATVTSTPARDGALDLDSITSDGFTAIVDDAAPVDITVFWEAWGGADITVALDLSIAEPSADGDVDYTVTGFASTDTDDQIVMLFGCQSTAAAGTAERASSGLMVGFASGAAAGENVVLTGSSDDASGTSDTDRYGLSSQCLAMIAVAGGNPTAQAALTQFNTNGFRLNWDRTTTGRKYIALAIKGGAWRAGDYALDATTAGNTTTVSGLPFVPLGVLFMTHFGAENTAGSSSTQDRISFGTASSTSSRRAMGHLAEDGTADAEIDLAIEYDQILVEADTGGATDTKQDLDALNTDGFRVIEDVGGGNAACWVGYLTFGSAVPGQPTMRRWGSVPHLGTTGPRLAGVR
jgi:hypothetical protein